MHDLCFFCRSKIIFDQKLCSQCWGTFDDIVYLYCFSFLFIESIAKISLVFESFFVQLTRFSSKFCCKFPSFHDCSSHGFCNIRFVVFSYRFLFLWCIVVENMKNVFSNIPYDFFGISSNLKETIFCQLSAGFGEDRIFNSRFVVKLACKNTCRFIKSFIL